MTGAVKNGIGDDVTLVLACVSAHVCVHMCLCVCQCVCVYVCIFLLLWRKDNWSSWHHVLGMDQSGGPCREDWVCSADVAMKSQSSFLVAVELLPRLQHRAQVALTGYHLNPRTLLLV